MKALDQHNDKKVRGNTVGLTLVEVLIALGITAIIMVGVFSFYMQFYKIGYTNELRNQINRDIRQLTGELSRMGRQANDHVIYETADSQDHDAASDRKLEGASGDMVVFVYKEDSSTLEISRLVGYYRDTTGAEIDGFETGGLRRFDVVCSPASSKTIEELIPSTLNSENSDLVVDLSRGLADGRLFYNFLGRSLMVSVQIYHGNDAKRVTETYNFTISPRG